MCELSVIPNPPPLTVFMLRSAPSPRRTRTASKCPLLQASHNAVLPIMLDGAPKEGGSGEAPNIDGWLDGSKSDLNANAAGAVAACGGTVRNICASDGRT